MKHTNNTWAAYDKNAIWASGATAEDALATYYHQAQPTRRKGSVVATAPMTQRLADHVEAHEAGAHHFAYRVLPGGILDLPEPIGLDLVALGDIAVMAGVRKTTVTQWVHRGLMPEPVARTSAGLIWNRAGIMTWLLSTGRVAPDSPETLSGHEGKHAPAAL